jgi:hypothetical protein
MATAPERIMITTPTVQKTKNSVLLGGGMGRTKSRRSISFRGMGAARTLDLLSSGGSKPKGRAMNRRFVDFANAVAEGSGYPAVFAAAIVVVVVWLAAGPVFHFSDTWQLVMNTLTSVVTFLMGAKLEIG